MREIELATGADLGSESLGKKKKGKKKKYPNLSDLKQNANTARSRLEKKVFNKYVTSCSSHNWQGQVKILTFCFVFVLSSSLQGLHAQSSRRLEQIGPQKARKVLQPVQLRPQLSCSWSEPHQVLKKDGF